MKNPWDPFGVFSEWRGQEPEDQLTEAEIVTDSVIDDHWPELVSLVRTGVEQGMERERKNCVELIKKHLNTSDDKVKRLIDEIIRRKNDK